MGVHLDFNDENIQKLFGHEAAEDENDERLKQYFFKTKIYNNFTSNLPLRILVGHKGTGKSAMVKFSAFEDYENGRLPIFIQPNDVYNINSSTANDFLTSVREWEEGLKTIIQKKILERLNFHNNNDIQKIKHFGNKIMEFVLETVKNVKDSIDLDPTQRKLVEQFLNNKKVVVYIDDLDRGWLNKKEDIKRISALLNAIRDISNENRNVLFKIALRTDVYYAVRTSDESTDKIEGSVIWYSWSNHEILQLLVKRITTFLNDPIPDIDLESKNQQELSKYLNTTMEHIFKGKGKWSHVPTYKILMSLIRKRPRDLVKLCTLAARSAYKADRSIITSLDFQNIFEEYSQGRIQDTINEYRSELPEIERLLMGMKPNKVEKRASKGYVYTSADLYTKISNVLQGGEMLFSNRNKASSKELAAFLYKINFLTARKLSGDGKLHRKYFEESRYISGNFADFGFDWEIHPAYRWALQPDSIESIYDQLEINEITFL
ncbi:hypothetical protein GPA07_17850 [Bacillus sp. ms-22]|uniref:P-loop ATPase, Sll1717 family n=1 Tax=Bacillus sp. ms-22 TaxID=2683680 RepID=UPI0012FCC1BF|nr:hypothetical protein [Bacillus sp. ms-22]QGX67189.1 hypothetical protein GPA07_17850 [Bacillus sp. ms-22]